MPDQSFFLRLIATCPVVLLSAMIFIARVNSSVDGRASIEAKPQRTSAERQARLARAPLPEPLDNPAIEPNHTIIGCWVPLLLNYSNQRIQLHADGTFDLWQGTCVDIYRDYPIHGRYLFDGTEVRLGVDPQLDQFVWTHVWSLCKYEGETFLVPEEEKVHSLDPHDPRFLWRLHFRDGEWDKAKQIAFFDAQFDRYNAAIPANALYPENVE